MAEVSKLWSIVGLLAREMPYCRSRHFPVLHSPIMSFFRITAQMTVDIHVLGGFAKIEEDLLIRLVHVVELCCFCPDDPATLVSWAQASCAVLLPIDKPRSNRPASNDHPQAQHN